MELRQLVYFKTVAACENISRAAELLFITPPTLSKSISNLEKELGVRLFDRVGGNRITLNRFGKSFLKRVSAALKELEEGKVQIQDNSSITNGELWFSVPSYDVIEGILIRFVETHPFVSIHQTYLRASEMEKDLLSGDIDFALHYIPLNPDRFNWEPLFEGQFMALISDKHPLSSRPNIKLSELAEYPFVINNGISDQKDIVYHLCQKAGFTPKILFEGDSPVLLGNIIEDNRAVSLVASQAEAIVESNLQSRTTYNPHLVAVPISVPDCRYTVGIITLKGHYLPNVAWQFLDFIRTEIPKFYSGLKQFNFI